MFIIITLLFMDVLIRFFFPLAVFASSPSFCVCLCLLLLLLLLLPPLSPFASRPGSAPGPSPSSSDLCRQFLSQQRSAFLFLRSARLLPTNQPAATPPGAAPHWPWRTSSRLRHTWESGRARRESGQGKRARRAGKAGREAAQPRRQSKANPAAPGALLGNACSPAGLPTRFPHGSGCSPAAVSGPGDHRSSSTRTHG